MYVDDAVDVGGGDDGDCDCEWYVCVDICVDVDGDVDADGSCDVDVSVDMCVSGDDDVCVGVDDYVYVAVGEVD